MENTMNRLVSSSLVVAGMLLAAGASAEEKAKSMDANSDGMVSASEHADASRMKFEKMDANHDGSVTAAEMDQSSMAMSKDHQMRQPASADKIKMMDSDGDGKLSAAEYSAGTQKMFDSADTDKNGSISRAEMEASHKPMAGHK
jgi:Ca2+-binding EF-hand superfamily protein